MSGTGWVLTGCLAVGYLVLLFVCGTRTFQRGHLVLGFLGILLPVLWLVGALLPPRRHTGPSTAP
jgi:hypothetical protein